MGKVYCLVLRGWAVWGVCDIRGLRQGEPLPPTPPHSPHHRIRSEVQERMRAQREVQERARREAEERAQREAVASVTSALRAAVAGSDVGALQQAILAAQQASDVPGDLVLEAVQKLSLLEIEEQAERLAAERVVAERTEAERVEAERAAAERAATERAEAERAEAELVEAEREAAELAAADRVEAERAAAEARAAAAAEREAAQRAAAERAELDRVAAAEARAAEEEERTARAIAEREAAERAALEARAAAERAIAEREAAQRAAAEATAAAEAERAARVSVVDAAADALNAAIADGSGARLEAAIADAISRGVPANLPALAAAKRLLQQSRLLQQWERSSSDIDWTDAVEVGSGSFGRVFKVRLAGELLAAKCIVAATAADRQKAREIMRREVRALACVRHPHVVAMYGICVDQPERPCILLELAQRGSLRDVLDDATVELSDGVRRKLLHGIVSGMARLHSQRPQPILHHDLKSHNVLIFDEWCAKITDFGLSVGGGLSTLSSTLPSNGGTLAYQAPELFGVDDDDDDDDDGNGNGAEAGGAVTNFTKACDMYAFGVVAFEVATRAVVWAGKMPNQIMTAVMRGRRPRMNEEQSASFAGTLAARCWAQSPGNRPFFAELLPEFSGGGGGRMVQEEDAPLIQPDTKWEEFQPQQPCLVGLRQNEGVRACVRDIDGLVRTVQEKVLEVRSGFPPEARALADLLDDDELAAAIAYTHDLELPGDTKTGNLYYELNIALRAKTPEARRMTMRTWGEFVHYLLRGLAKLPAHEGVVLRGIPDAALADQYTLHRPIKWRAFTSSTTSEDAAAAFFDAGSPGIIFRITVKRGKRITPLSFFPEEGEVLLWPGQRYIVTRAAYVENGRTYIDLIEELTELEY